MLATPPGLRVVGVSKRFGAITALDNVSLEIPPGDMLVLLGPSGCGKTTLLRILAGLEPADQGVVVVDDDDLVGPGLNVPPERRRIGMVFQDWALFPHLTVAGNVAYGVPRGRTRQDRVAEVLSLVDMEHLAHRKPDELSAGQAQRVALARALAPRPRLLLFDEPFSSLDAELRKRVRRDVTDLMRKVEMTAVFVTHDQEEAFVLGDTVAVMDQAKIVQVGSPADIYANPATPWVAGFVGDANLLIAEAAGHEAETVVGRVALRDQTSGKCRVLARPEHVKLVTGTTGEVVEVDFFGHDTTYRVRLTGLSPQSRSGGLGGLVDSGGSGGSATSGDIGGPGGWGDSAGSGSLGGSRSPVHPGERTNSGQLMVRAIAAPQFQLGDRVDLTYQGPPTVAFASGASSLL